MIVLILVTLLAGLQSLPAQSLRWFKSDGTAIRLDSTTEAIALSSAWALSVETSNRNERIVHYRQGVADRAWLREFDTGGRLTREAQAVRNNIVEERVYDSQERLSLERQFLDQGSVLENQYGYELGRLVSIRTSLDGKVTLERRYFHSPDGRLSLVRESSSTFTSQSGARQPGTTSSAEWSTDNGSLIMRTFDHYGRLVLTKNYHGPDLVMSEERIWQAGHLHRIVETYPSENRRSETLYTHGSNIDTITEYTGDKQVLTQKYAYDQDGRVSQLHKIHGVSGKEEVVRYTYQPDGSPATETRMLDGQVAMVRRHTAVDEMFEEYFDRGVLFARLYYSAGLKTKEEIIVGGKVVRERQF
jgi:hypothetical protein